MEVTSRSVPKKDGTVAEILEISEITNKNELYKEIKDFVSNDDYAEEYVLLKVADLDKEGKGYKYLSVECIQDNIAKAMKQIIEETYNFKNPIFITKRKLKKAKGNEKKNRFEYTLKYIFKDYTIQKGDYLFHENELIQLYGSIDERIKNFKYNIKFSVEKFEEKGRYDGERLSRKENLSRTLIEETVKRLVCYEMGVSAKDTFLTCICGYAVKCETFDNELDIDIEIKGNTPDETDRLFYEKHKDLQTDAFSELMYGINVFELFSKLKRGLSEETIISACQLVGYKQWYDDAEKAESMEISNSRTENVPNTATIKNIRILTERMINFLDREGTVTAFDFPFADNEQSGYSEVISEGEGEYLTEYGIFITDMSDDVPSYKTVLKILVHYIMAYTSQMEMFDNIIKIGILNPRLNTCYYIFTENIPVSIIREVKYDLICYRK